MKLTALAAIAATGIALAGCATVVKGTSQSIAITTPPVDGANCTLSSPQGNWMVVSPGVATVQRSKEDIQVRCDKAGYKQGFATSPSNFEGWTVGNIFFAAGLGLAVDAATGAINQYPHAFQVPMMPAETAVPAATLKPYAGKPTS
jgi:hypothetical protein